MSVEEIEELNSKLLSDKAKVREEGVRELISYLDASGGVSLCPLLDRQTALFCRQDRIPSSTWPGVLRALCQCINAEVVSSKKRGPKPVLAKTLRSLIQKAEDFNRPGVTLFLLRAVKSFFRHASEVILEVPSFVPDYSHILRQLLTISEYRLHMSKKVYSNLLHFFMDKVKTLVYDSPTDVSLSKEEAFRTAMTLHCLLQNPPGDFSEQLREDITQGLSDIFLHLRDEGRIAKKLLASLNSFLVMDGPNLGDLVVDIHAGVKDFMVRTWLTTRDRELKDGLVLYARLQLKLRTVVTCTESRFIQQMLPLVEKELDQSVTFLVESYRFDGGREERVGTVTRGMLFFLEFAASILIETGGTAGLRMSAPVKKQRTEDVFTTVNDRLMKGKYLWCGAFCFLVRHHYRSISDPTLFEWLKTLRCTLERILVDASSTHSFEALVWVLRCLQDLSLVWPFVTFEGYAPHSKDECKSPWEFIWDALLHWLPLLSNVHVIVEEASKLLGYIVVKSLLPVYSVPQDFWSLKPFAETPSGSLLFFVASLFSTSAEQIAMCEDLELRKKLLKWAMSSIDTQGNVQLKNISNRENLITLLSAATLALTIGSVPHPLHPFIRSTLYSPVVDELDEWAKLEDHDRDEEEDLDALNHSPTFLAECGSPQGHQSCGALEGRNSLISFPTSQALLKELVDHILSKISVLTMGNQQHVLYHSFGLSSIITNCIIGVVHTMQRRGQDIQDWSSEGRVWQGLLGILRNCVSIIDSFTRNLPEPQEQTGFASWHQSLSQIVMPATTKALKILLASDTCGVLLGHDEMGHLLGRSRALSCVLEGLLLSISSFFQASSDMLEAVSDSNVLMSPVSSVVLHVQGGAQEELTEARLLDADFDLSKETAKTNTDGYGDTGDATPFVNSGSYGILKRKWRSKCVFTIALFAEQLPEKTCDVLMDLLRLEKDPQVQKEILISFCRSISYASSNHIPFLVNEIQDKSGLDQDLESGNRFVLTAVDTLMSTMLECMKGDNSGWPSHIHGVRTKWNVSEKVVHQLATLLREVAEKGFVQWHFRKQLAEAITKMLLIQPTSAQGLTDKFLGLLHDADYRVRWFLSKKVAVLFQLWTGHDELFQDVCCNFGLQMVMATKERVVTATEVSLGGRKDQGLAETAVLTLGELAAISDKVEDEAVFMICANAAKFPFLRMLACTVLDRVARQLHYPNRWKYLGQLLGAILTRWVKVCLPLPALVEIRELLVCKSEPVEFLIYCCPTVLPPLFLYDCENELSWLAKVMSKSIATLVKDFFPAIFAALLPMYCNGSEAEKEKAIAVLQGKMLAKANLSEDERDQLIKKNMVSIVNCIFQLCSCGENPQFPFFSIAAIMAAVQTVVDGFCESELPRCSSSSLSGSGVEDRLHIFRPDRVFMFILQLHFQIEAAFHPRHRRVKLAGLACLIDIIKDRISVPITCRYLFHTVLQCFGMEELEEECCQIIMNMLGILSGLPQEVSTQVLGAQLQLIVSELVARCVKHNEGSNGDDVTPSPALSLLEQVILNADSSLHQYMRELPPFPNLPCFENVRAFHAKISANDSLIQDLSKLVSQITEMPPLLQSRSLQNLHRIFTCRSEEEYSGKNAALQDWSYCEESGSALWRLARLCFECNSSDLNELAADLIAKIGIGDPHAVVFTLPGHDAIESASFLSSQRASVESISNHTNSGVSEDLVRVILIQLKSYLFDEHVLVIELAAQTLKGLLSTEKGQRVFRNMDSKEQVYLNVFSRGVNPKIVEDMLNIVRAESSKKAYPLENDTLWEVSGKAYDSWICSLVYSLIHYSEDTVLRLCQGLVHCKSLFAEALLPHVLGSLAARTGPNSNVCKLISTQIQNHIFTERNQSTRSIRLFLEALNELRHSDVLANMKMGQEYAKGRGSSKVYWLELDYLQTARIAQKCGAYFTSALYVDYWCEENFGRLTLGEPDFSDDEELPKHVELLLLIFTRINEPDGVYGVVRSHKLIPQLLKYEHEGNWSGAVESYDLLLRSKELSTPSTRLISSEQKSMLKLGGMDMTTVNEAEHFSSDWKYNKGLMKSLQQIGCEHVLKMYCKGLAAEKGSLERNPEFQELQYEGAWRAGKWESHSTLLKAGGGFLNSYEQSRSNFNASLHCCLRSLLEGDIELFSSQLKQAKQELVKSISFSSFESSLNVYPSIIKLQILECLSKSWSLRWRSETRLGAKGKKLLGPYIPSSEQVAVIDTDWQHKLRRMQFHYDLLEPFIVFRKVLYEVLECRDFMPQHLLEFATLARKGGRLNQAAAALYELKQCYKEMRGSVHDLGAQKMSAAGKVEEAKILWAQGQHEMAVNLLKYVINHYNVEDDSANVYCLAGKWLAETRSDSSHVILENYLQRSVELSENQEKCHGSKWIERKSRAHYRLAHYADSLFRSYEERLTSSEWQAALRLRQHKARELEVLKRRLRSTMKADKSNSAKKKTSAVHVEAPHMQDEKDCTRKIIELQKQLVMDNEEAQRLQHDRNSFLIIALNNYRCCLTTGDKYDMRVVFRVTSLWFNLSMNQGVVTSMLETINQVKSFKFLPLVYQIASRLGVLKESQESPSFQYVLTCLVKKIAVDHPYHSIYQLLALANGDRVKDRQRSKTAFVIDLDKKQAAEDLLNSLMSNRKALIQQMKQMVEIYIRLAELEVKREDVNKRLTLPRDIRSVRQLELVPVITAPISVDPSAEYPDGYFPYFKGLSDRIVVMNGINAPKVVECLGSDGHEYRQLAKSGNDDLRQDAVMEQFFGLVNMLLQHHPDTHKRRLGIRTYKVVPFTPSAGVLEWVDGTMPLGEYLLGSNRKGGAHSRYGVGDWTFPACREHMNNETDKLAAFQTVCQNFRPVLHYFFLEQFSQPAEWFKKRLAYTRSVATSSMVGYIVGLGDRHSMNILIDQKSAEVVHIDLGVAFEQGLMLKSPERVPFRLTRDIVDGMGVSGVEGVFRRCCEETLLVMRMNKEALLTIIEVFIHDPLYKWALSPLKALQRQKDTNELDEASEDTSEMENFGEPAEGNRDAARALMRVKQKLDGYEAGDMRSIQGQVQQLVQDAQDLDNLCQMFPGWGAWL